MEGKEIETERTLSENPVFEPLFSLPSRFMGVDDFMAFTRKCGIPFDSPLNTPIIWEDARLFLRKATRYSQVFVGYRERNPEDLIVIKFPQLSGPESGNETSRRLIDEADFLKDLEAAACPYWLKLLKFAYGPYPVLPSSSPPSAEPHPYLVLPFVYPGITLGEFMNFLIGYFFPGRRGGEKSWNNWKTFLSSFAPTAGLQIATAFCVAHRRGILVRDKWVLDIMVRPPTKEDGFVTCIDAGLFRYMDNSPKRRERDLTPPYMILGKPDILLDPEYCSSRIYDKRADIYLLGALLFVLASGDYPFERSYEEPGNNRSTGCPRFHLLRDMRVDSRFFDLIEAMLERDPQNRPELEEVCHILRQIARESALAEFTGPAILPQSESSAVSEVLEGTEGAVQKAQRE